MGAYIERWYDVLGVCEVCFMRIRDMCSKPTGQKPVELTKKHTNCFYWNKLSLVSTKILINSGILEVERQGLTGQRGLPLEVDGPTTFSGKFPPRPKRSIYISTKITGNFDIMENEW